jgi:hypothetical protein
VRAFLACVGPVIRSEHGRRVDFDAVERFPSTCGVADHMLGMMEENAVEVGSG